MVSHNLEVWYYQRKVVLIRRMVPIAFRSLLHDNDALVASLSWQMNPCTVCLVFEAFVVERHTEQFVSAIACGWLCVWYIESNDMSSADYGFVFYFCH